MRKTFLYSLVLSILFFSCKKNNDNPSPGLNLGNGVFILNQGNFTAGNASLSYFQNNGEVLYNDIFYTTNNVPLGDVAQSITMNGSTSYIVVNNSGFIYVINSRTVEYQARITGFSSPRFMTIVSQDKAYVSDLYSTSIAIVDISKNQVTGSVEVGRSTEEMELIGSEVFAANWSGYGQTLRNDKILVINTDNDVLTDSIEVGLEPNSMVVDRNGYLWVLCSGGYLNEEIPTLWKIDAPKRQVIKKFNFDDINTSPDNLEINGAGDSLFFLNQGVFRMSVTDSDLPASPFISISNMQQFSYLGVDPETGIIYVSDPLDYAQNGIVYRFSPNGNYMDQMTTGIIPGPFGFNY